MSEAVPKSTSKKLEMKSNNKKINAFSYIFCKQNAELFASLLKRCVSSSGKTKIIVCFLLFGFLLITNCGEIKLVTGVDERDGFILRDTNIKGFRFESQGIGSSTTPTQSYWLKKGEKISPVWDALEFRWQEKESLCSFANGSTSENCQICDYCNPPASFEGQPCLGLSYSVLHFRGFKFEIVSYPEFIETENPQTIFDYIPDQNTDKWFGTCTIPRNQASPVLIEPQQSGIFRLINGAPEKVKVESKTNSEIKIHVVEAGQDKEQKAAYQLILENFDGRNYWTWEVEGDDTFWMENFSPSLHVSEISIYTGICNETGSPGKKCTVPGDAAPVKPSRILFLPNFDNTVSGHNFENELRCYRTSAAAGDTFINLENCRERFDTTLGNEVQKLATPTYEQTFSAVNDKLKWLIGFKVNEGADADLMNAGNDPMPVDTNLIIEFSIKAN